MAKIGVIKPPVGWREWKARAEELEKQLIYGFYEEEVPSYSHNPHELSELVMADECNGMVARIVELRRLAYVPGMHKCPKCKFVLVSNILNMAKGTITANTDKPDNCPNGCGSMEKVAERDAGNDMANRLIKSVAASPDDLRARGWAVAIHNDYMLKGELHSFWLLTKDGRAVKGEGKTDDEALNRIREAIEAL